MRISLILGAAALALALAVAPAHARSSGGGSVRISSGHSSSSHGSAPRAPRSHTPRTSGASKAKALPAGTHFVRKTCKTAACKAKHPSGEYMLPIKPKKGGAA